MNSTFYKITIWILALVALGASACLIIYGMTQHVSRLQASWDGDSLHIYSAKDGPWIVTHLVQLRPNSRFYDSIAQLPVPVTIIDSRGEHFPLGSMQSLPWIDHSGARVAPPKAGQPMSAFYFAPEQALYQDYTK
jgi:hypothetical protein